jgi:hypothetical protein
MITAQEEKGIRIPDLKGPQVQHTLEFPFSALIPTKKMNIEADLDTKISPVNIIAQEKVSSFCWIPSNFEQFHQVILAE